MGTKANITYSPTQSSEYDAGDVQHYQDFDIDTFQRTLRKKDKFGRPMDAFFESVSLIYTCMRVSMFVVQM